MKKTVCILVLLLVSELHLMSYSQNNLKNNSKMKTEANVRPAIKGSTALNFRKQAKELVLTWLK